MTQTVTRDPRADLVAERDAANVADPALCDAHWCGRPVTGLRRDGKPAYCGDACKSRTYRERKANRS